MFTLNSLILYGNITCESMPVRCACFHRHVRTVWVCAEAIVKATASDHIREHVGDRMTRPRSSQRLHTAAYTCIYHTYPSTYWHACLSLCTSHAHTFNNERHRATSPVRWSLLGPRMQSAAEGRVCVSILSHRRTLSERRRNGLFCCRFVFDAMQLSLITWKTKIFEVFIYVQTEIKRQWMG